MKNNFRTKDLYLSAFLFAKRLPLEQVERENNVCWFIFGKDSKINTLTDEYWSGTAICNAKAYADAVRTLKDRIFNE